MLESDGLDSTTEQSVPLFHQIEGGVQYRDNYLDFISDNNVVLGRGSSKT